MSSDPKPEDGNGNGVQVAARTELRARTVSMAQRLAKQPLSEGFDLWDRGYTLGAMRLFTAKAENAPPFQVGQILDAMGHLLQRLEESEDARDNFNFAAEKYELIGQPILSKIMAAKAVEATKGPEEAFLLIDQAVKAFDGDKVSFGDTLTAKQKPAFGRLYHYRAYLLLGLGKIDEALADVKHAVDLGFDRVHLALMLQGQLEEEKDNAEGALTAYSAAIAKNANIVPAYLPLAMLQKKAGKVADSAATLDRAIALHPRATFIRQKAYLMSEGGQEKEALAYLDRNIADPPHEEAEAVFSADGSTLGELYKAKAAILADAGKLKEAKACAESALKASRIGEDAEATSMIEAINEALSEEAEKKE